MLEPARTAFAAVVAEFEDLEPPRLSGEQARAVVEFAGEMSRFATGLQALCAERAAECSGWKEAGLRSKAAWLAGVTRSAISEASATLEISRSLASLPAVAGAALSGDLSAAELRTVTAAAACVPSAQQDLLDATEVLDLGGLRRLASHVKASAARPDLPEQRADLHERRYLRFWSDGDGMFRLTGAFTADDGARILGAVRSRASFVADDAIRAKVPPEPQPAYDADALVALCVHDRRMDTATGHVATPRRDPSMGLLVNLEALRRGHLLADEVCQIPGVGPVSLEAAESLLGEATLKVVVRDGVDVRCVTHLGRAVPAHVMSALETRDPLCVVPGCTMAVALEVDHWKVPYSEGGATELWNLARICRFHHRLKTYRGFSLDGGPGRWRWRPPAEPVGLDSS